MGQSPAQLSAKQHAFVAAYLGPARLNATKAAKLAGYSEKTAKSIGQENLTKPDIQAAVQAWRDEVKRSAIADVDYRVAVLNELETKLHDVITARAAEYTGTSVVGGETGLVVRRYKMVGSGESAQLVEEYEVDTATIKELRAVHEQAAKELGQWESKVHVGGDFLDVLKAFGRDTDSN
jgi:hypothetical protein